jgi:hypothetical protein
MRLAGPPPRVPSLRRQLSRIWPAKPEDRNRAVRSTLGLNTAGAAGRRAVALATLAAALAIAPPPAHADEPSYRAVIDQVVLEPSSLGGQRLRVTLSMLSLTGQTVDVLESASVRLVIGGSRSDVPFAIGSYGATTTDTAIVVLVQTSIDFADVLPVIADTLDDGVLAKLGDRAQVAILPYGESQGAGKLGAVKQARSRVGALASDGSVGEPRLLDTLERALTLLRNARTEPEGRPLRKLVVVVGDGRDQSSDHDRVTRLGRRAAKDGVRIHSLAHSPKDVRRPLLLLGELSKQSHGTFRWVRGARADSWMPAFQQLDAELARQHVLTFFLAEGEDVAGSKLKIELVGRTQITTNDAKIPEAECSGAVCDPGAYCADDRCVQPRGGGGRGVVGWIVLLAGSAIGALVLLGFIGYLLTRRQNARVNPPIPTPGAPGPAPVSVQPAAVPSTLPSTPPAMPSAPPATSGPRFCFMSGPHAGREVALRHGLMIGKAPTCDLVIDDGYTSGQHAQIGMDHFGNCRIYDHGSTNGTYINGVRITEYALEHGTSVRIGSTELRFLAQ